MKKLFYLFIITILFGCGTIKKLQSGINMAVDNTVIIPIAVTQFLKDASSEIYLLDKLSDNDTVQLNRFDIKFYNNKDSQVVNLKDIEFYFLKDTVYYNKFEYSKLDLKKYAGTLECFITSYYTTPISPERKCIEAKYKIIDGKISNEKPYGFCEK